MNVLANLVAKLLWTVILNAQNAVNKIIYLVIFPNVSVARKKDTFKRTALKSPLTPMNLVTCLNLRYMLPFTLKTSNKRQVCPALFVIRKAIYLINVQNVSVARKKDTFKGNALRLKPLPQK